MSTNGSYAHGTFFFHNFGGFHQRTCCIHHIIYKDYILTLYIANKLHFLNHIGFFALLIADYHITIEELSIGVCPFRSSHIRRGYAKVLQVQGLDIRDKYGRGIEMIYRNFKEALNLVSM